MSPPDPKAWRLLLGFLLAPVLPSIFYALLLKGDLSLLGLVLVIGGYVPTILIGLPLYLVLRNRVRLRVWIVMLAGGFVAVVPWVILSLLSPADYASLGDCVSVINGRTTWCGHVRNFELYALLFALGAVGGLVFWICAVWKGFGLGFRAPAKI